MGSKAWLKSLPDDTPIEFDPARSKTRESEKHHAVYRKAKTTGELKKLNPNHYINDLAWDYQRCILTMPTLADGLSAISVLICATTTATARENLSMQTDA
jgi:hypothetical protein